MKKQSPKGKKILIIEDDFDLLWMLKKLLTTQGYPILTAVTGAQGIEVFSRNIFDIGVVVMDLSLPDEDGEVIVQEIFKVVPDIPIIITTGSEDKTQLNRLETAGIKKILVKPFDLQRLSDVVSEYV
jgi:DNA-binding NtrC family response regulator